LRLEDQMGVDAPAHVGHPVSMADGSNQANRPSPVGLP
jgi:hypothetical protein